MFVTYFMGILNIRTGEVTYCNAGHNRPYIINKAKNTISQLPRIHGLPMGTFERPYTSEKTMLLPGDTIVLYTDGVTEAFNIKDEQFSDERLRKLIEENSHLNAVELTDLILKEVRAFANGCEQSDDITILILTFNGKK
jgi:sigma-B regulation protein RsbU (phosphoserine phosphatase)